MNSSRTLKAVGAAILGTLVGTGPTYAVISLDANGKVTGKAIYAKESLTSTGAIDVDDVDHYVVAGGATNVQLVGGLQVPASTTLSVTYTLENMVFVSLSNTSITAETNTSGTITTPALGTAVLAAGGTSGSNTATFRYPGAAGVVHRINTSFILTPGSFAVQSGGKGSITQTVTSGGLSNSVTAKDAVLIEPEVIQVDLLPTPIHSMEAGVQHDFKKFTHAVQSSPGGRWLGDGVLKAAAGQVSVSLKSDPATLVAATGAPATLATLINGSRSRIEYDGDISFVKDVFLDSDRRCASTSGTTSLLTEVAGSKTWKTGRAAPTISVTQTQSGGTIVGGRTLCIEVDGETTIPEVSNYQARVDFTGIGGAEFPPMDKDFQLANIVYNGSTVTIPYLTTYEGYNQRLVMINRWTRAVPYKVKFESEPGITVDPDELERLLEPGTTMMRVRDLLGDSITGGNRTAATLRVEIEPRFLDVATVQVNRETGSTDTVVHF